MTFVKLKRAIDTDILRFNDCLPVEGGRYIGWTGWVGRRAVGTGGVVVRPDGAATGLFACAPDYRHVLGVGFHRRVLKLFRRLERAGLKEIVATCDRDIPRAEAWLLSLGFAPRGDAYGGEDVFVRRA